MVYTWDIKHSVKDNVIEITFHDGAYDSNQKWVSFADSIPGIIDAEKDDESKLFNNLVLNLTPKDHTYTCAQWTFDERFFFPKPPSYSTHHFKQSRNLIQSIFKSSWGAGWGDSPDFLFISSPGTAPDQSLISEHANRLKEAHISYENRADDIIKQISESYERILYVEDYLLGLIMSVPNHLDSKAILQLLQTQISTAAQPFGLTVPNLIEPSK